MMIKKYFMKSVSRITKDFKQKELLLLKLVFFVQASTICVLYPYISIHSRVLGISVEEVSIMSAVIPIITMIMPPLAGMVADKIGNFKLLLAFFSLIGGASALLLLLVPVGRATVTYPERITLNFGCAGPEKLDLNDGYFQLGLYGDISCKRSSGVNRSSSDFNLDTRLEACGFVCTSFNQTTRFPELLSEDEETPTDVILKGRSYVLRIGTNSYHYNLTKEDLPKSHTKEDILSHRLMSNDANLNTSIRKLSSNEYFFPAPSLVTLKCRKVSTGDSKEEFFCYLGTPGEEDSADLSLNKSLKFTLKNIRGNDDVLNSFDSDFVEWSAVNESNKFTCRKADQQEEEVSLEVSLHNPENNLEVLETLSLSECRPRCLASAVRKTLCSNLKEEVIYDPQFTFWTYMVIRVFMGVIGSTSYAMYEVAVIAILREQKADYGLQRIYSLIGGMISSPLSGLLIDYASQGKGYTDFRPAFYLYAGLKLGTTILLLFINLEFKKAATNVISDVIQVLKNLEIIALLVSCFILGSAWGYIESFLFWFLEDMGATTSLMGITITVGGIAGIPLLVLSGPIIDKIGHANVLFIGFVFYAIRMLGYSVIYNPYHCLFFEAMESITSSLTVTAAITYAAKLSTTTTDGSIQGLVGGIYFGVGRGAGSLIGGYLMKAFGTRPTYRILAVFTIITGVMYYLFNHFYLRKRPQTEGNEICKKEPKAKKNLDSEIKIITEKPEGKKYGAVQTENNNLVDPKEMEKMGKNNEGYDGEEDKKEKNEDRKEKEEKKENEEKESHNNPGYVPDEEKEKERREDEGKKKED